MIRNQRVLIVGSGFIAEHYLNVISSLKISCVVVGRGKKNIDRLRSYFKNIDFFSGGISQYLKKNSIKQFTHFINLANIELCIEITNELIDFGAKNILLEKPGGLEIKELENLDNYALKKGVNLYIGYNRRFFESVKVLIDLAKEDGGINNISFEFTEWIHSIDINKYSSKVLEKWIISNSSHVLDTVFYLIGLPEQISTLTYGKNNIDWHKSGSIFIGSGFSVNGIPFSYNTNWNSAGRWAIEITTKSKRFYLKPMEKLYVQNKGEIKISEINLPRSKDVKFKPGIYDLVFSFIQNDFSKLVSIKDQINHIRIYNKIGSY